MKLIKGERYIVKMKFNGHCAYCGDMLQKGWHVDHIEPVIRFPKSRRWWHLGKEKIYAEGIVHPELETINNLNPACPPCAMSKYSLTVEQFREKIIRNLAWAKSLTPYRTAKRYGMIFETNRPIKFYFEKYNEAIIEKHF